MLLLVIGLVAVIGAVLVAVFLVMRRRGDDDEPGGRQSVRDRLRGRGGDTRWSTDPRTAGKPAARGTGLSRRPAGEPRGYGGPGRDYEPAGFDQSRGYEPSPRGYGERPAPSRDGQPTERIQPARRGGRYQDVPEPAAPVGARVPRPATAPRRAGVGADTGPGAALYDTGPSAADFATTRIHADPDLADSDVFPRVRADIPETEAKARTKTQAKGRGRPPVAGTTTMTTTGRARSGTSSPTSSTGRSCPPTSRSRPRPAARSRAPRPRSRPRPGPAPSRQRPGARGPGPSPPRPPAWIAQAAVPPTALRGRPAARAHPGGRTAQIPTLAALPWPTGRGPRRPPIGCRSGTAARPPTRHRPAPHRSCPRPRPGCSLRPVARRRGRAPTTTR